MTDDLRVEEGARVREGEIIARLESQDYDAQVRRAQAHVQQAEAQIASGRAAIRRAEADLAEARRQLAVHERLSKEHILATDTLEASRARVRVLDAALSPSQPAEVTSKRFPRSDTRQRCGRSSRPPTARKRRSPSR